MTVVAAGGGRCSKRTGRQPAGSPSCSNRPTHQEFLARFAVANTNCGRGCAPIDAAGYSRNSNSLGTSWLGICRRGRLGRSGSACRDSHAWHCARRSLVVLPGHRNRVERPNYYRTSCCCGARSCLSRCFANYRLCNGPPGSSEATTDCSEQLLRAAQGRFWRSVPRPRCPAAMACSPAAPDRRRRRRIFDFGSFLGHSCYSLGFLSARPAPGMCRAGVRHTEPALPCRPYSR